MKYIILFICFSLVIIGFNMNTEPDVEITYKGPKPLDVNIIEGKRIQYEHSPIEYIEVKKGDNVNRINTYNIAKVKTPRPKIATVKGHYDKVLKFHDNKVGILKSLVKEIVSPVKETVSNIPRNNIALISTGSSFEDSMTYNSFLIRKYNRRFKKSTILYGDASKKTADTLFVKNNEGFLKASDFKSHGQFNKSNFDKVLANHKLLFIFGHGTPEGMPIWKDILGKTISPKDHDYSKIVMINTNCFGGIFAKKVKCGFFSAHPKYTSSGCWMNPKDKVINYGEEFLKASYDKEKTLEQMHYQASFFGNNRDVPYSSLDAYAEEYTKDKKFSIYWEEVIEEVSKISSNEELMYLMKLHPYNEIIYIDDNVLTVKDISNVKREHLFSMKLKAESEGWYLCSGTYCYERKSYYKKLLAAKRLYTKTFKPKDKRFQEIVECSNKKIGDLDV